MSDFNDDSGDVDERIEALSTRIDQLRKQCRYQSAQRVARELGRTAKREGRVIPYLYAKFYLMNQSQSLLTPLEGQENAIEAIALLESEEQARAIQPDDFPQEHYDHTVGWMSACSYDNLATATAMLDGYNSAGTHDCINEGIQVCRRTGKLKCIQCFREYAASVYEAADDVDMALHYARTNARQVDPDPDNDRRWVGSSKEGQLLLASGQLAAAEEAFQRAWELRGTYHSPNAAALATQLNLAVVKLLLGRGESPLADRVTESEPPIVSTGETSATGDGADSTLRAPPEGEDVTYDLDRSLYLALAAAMHGDFDQSIKILTDWDRRLTAAKILDRWFDVRLRLAAVHRAAGRIERAEALEAPLETRAKKAHDWLTLRRLKRLRRAEGIVAPFPFAGEVVDGPFATTAASAAAESLSDPARSDAAHDAPPDDLHATPSDEANAPASETPSSASPAAAGEPSLARRTLDDAKQRLRASNWREDDVRETLHALLALRPSDAADAREAGEVVFLATVLRARTPIAVELPSFPASAASNEPSSESPAPEAPSAERGSSDELLPPRPRGEETIVAAGEKTLSGDEPLAPAPDPRDDPELRAKIERLAAEAVRDLNRRVWEWLQPWPQKFARDATLLSLSADFADSLRRDPSGPLTDEIGDDQLARWFSESLDLDADDPGNFARAGAYFLNRGDLGLAERALARGFRLDRQSSFLALRLAEVYQRTDRPRDALAVLDLCLREGKREPAVLWEAAMAARPLGQFDAMLTYLDAFAELAPEERWTHYYRAWALLETNRPDRALEAVEREAALSATQTFHVEALRTAALGDLDRVEECRAALGRLLAVPLRSVDYLSTSGVYSLLERVWKTVAQLGDALAGERAELEARMIAAGLTPDALFEAERKAGPKVEDVQFFRIVHRVPTPDDWSAQPGCLAGQEHWTSYQSVWGVLARDADEAEELVKAWQTRGRVPADAEIISLATEPGLYNDSPGVVWQSPNQYDDPSADDDDDDEDEDDDAND